VVGYGIYLIEAASTLGPAHWFSLDVNNFYGPIGSWQRWVVLSDCNGGERIVSRKSWLALNRLCL